MIEETKYLYSKSKILKLYKKRTALNIQINQLEKEVQTNQKKFYKKKTKGFKILSIEVELSEDVGYIYASKIIINNKSFELHQNDSKEKKAIKYLESLKFDKALITTIFFDMYLSPPKQTGRCKLISKKAIIKRLKADEGGSFLAYSKGYEYYLNSQDRG